VQYQEIEDYSEGLFRIKQNGRYGFTNRLGKVYIPPMYDYASSFANRHALVKKDNKYGIINFTNKFLLNASYEFMDRNSDGNYYVTLNKGEGKYRIYDIDKRKFLEQTFDSVYVSDTVVFTRVKKDGKIRYFNMKSYAYSFPGSFENALPFKGGYAAVKNMEKWGIVNAGGKEIIPLKYDTIEYEYFLNRLVFKTYLGEKCGLLDEHGKLVLPNEYEQIYFAAPNLLKVKKEGKFGIVKTTGSIIAEPKYTYLSNAAENPSLPDWPAVAEINGQYGMVNEKGEEIFPVKAKKIEYLGDGMYAVIMGKKSGLFNPQVSSRFSPQYEEIKPFNNGLAAIKKGKKWGYVNTKEELVIPLQFEDAGGFNGNTAAVKSKGLWGVIDRKGAFIVQPEYTDYVIDEKGQRSLFKNNKEYKLTDNGILK
jgi:hypothetical protein